MAIETHRGPDRDAYLLHRASGAAFGAGATVTAHARVTGRKRLLGNVHVSTAQAAGFPRVRQSADGVTWSRVDVVAVDGGQADFQYPIDVVIYLPYVQIQLTQGGAPSTFLYAWGIAGPA